ncbi:hypothetical protein AOL_s00215g542 [Orbilia oligospora ATCC 24927]|uniref:Uncharacterized protein n=1 Tax=Arthrobotrys oligospora (strain ATCC 24927 / CBS 115.81 / DSM 1491) TaxID=756982 RepID=G1XT44_ARTOA|nr:hypothetical protein AOL_s00215g542 [Orbilia oligospora ATCC 24927]EGX43806.1 hypothetical protein AOL_s00215g542 [Orbilia oligospora ATCC 24927]
MRILLLTLTLTLTSIPSTSAWSYLFWQVPPSLSSGPPNYGTKVFQPPAPCKQIPLDSQPTGLTITQFGENNVLPETRRYQANHQWLDPVRYIGLWHSNLRKPCEGLPDVIVRYYPDVYTRQTIDFRNLGGYTEWIGDFDGGGDLTFRYWGEIPFGDQYFQEQLVPGDVAVRNSRPVAGGIASYENNYVVASNAITVAPIRPSWGLDSSRWQGTGTVTSSREVTFTFPPNIQILTGQPLDREKEVGLGYVPENYRFATNQIEEELETAPPTNQMQQPEIESMVSNLDPNEGATLRAAKNLNRERLEAQFDDVRRSQQEILDQIARDRAQQQQQQNTNIPPPPLTSNPNPQSSGPQLQQQQDVNPPQPLLHPFLPQENEERLSPDQLADKVAQWTAKQWPKQQAKGVTVDAFVKYMNGLNLNLLRLRQYYQNIEQQIDNARKMQQRLREQMFVLQLPGNILASNSNQNQHQNILNPNILNPNILNPNILNPNILNPNILNPNILNPNPVQNQGRSIVPRSSQQQQQQQQGTQQLLPKECICPNISGVISLEQPAAGQPKDQRFLPDMPPNSLQSPEQVAPNQQSPEATDNINSEVDNSNLRNPIADNIRSGLQADDRLTDQNQSDKPKKVKSQEPKGTVVADRAYSSALDTVRKIFDTQKNAAAAAARTTSSNQASSETNTNCICPETPQPETNQNINPEAFPIRQSLLPVSDDIANPNVRQYLPGLSKKMIDEIGERKKKRREGIIQQSRLARLAELERSTEIKEKIEEQQENTEVNVQGSAVEEEKAIDDPELRSRILIEDEEGEGVVEEEAKEEALIQQSPLDLAAQLLIEEEDIQQNIPDLILREDEDRDRDVIFMDKSLYDTEIKEEEEGEDPETKLAKEKRRAEARVRNENFEMPVVSGSEFFEEIKDEVI